MNIIRWSHFREMEDRCYRNRLALEQLPGSQIIETDNGSQTARRLDTDITETKDEYLINAPVPVADRNDLDISIGNGRVTIRGRRRVGKAVPQTARHWTKSDVDTFSLSFVLPPDIDESEISVNVSNKVLNVHLPKGETAEAKTHRIALR